MTWTVFIVALLLQLFASSCSGAAETLERKLRISEGTFVRMSQPISEILITDPTVADVQITKGRDLFIYGKKSGRTHVVVLSDQNQVIYDTQFIVGHDLAVFQNLVKERFSDAKIETELSPGRMLLSGEVANNVQMETILQLANGVLGENEKLVNNLTLKSPMQVNLRVRIMEMNRTETENLGINWDILFNPGSLAINLISGRSPLIAAGQALPGASVAAGGSSTLIGSSGPQGSVNAVLDALVEQKLVKVLAEPNLTSRSGETASFFAGGEFPIPIASDQDQIRIEFKKFGVILDMTPTVLADNRIRLHIRPEVSELTSVGAIKLNNIAIPGVAARRTEATIELASGQSFAVAGLLQNQKKELVRQVPWLGELDILGPLFKSQEYQQSETELVVIATANIVKPLDPKILKSPDTPAHRGLKGSAREKSLAPETVDYLPKGGLRLNGPHGYIY